jgi:hypothetical protein
MVHRFAKTFVDGVMGGYRIKTRKAKKDLRLGDVVEIDAGSKLVGGWWRARITGIGDDFRDIWLKREPLDVEPLMWPEESE